MKFDSGTTMLFRHNQWLQIFCVFEQANSNQMYKAPNQKLYNKLGLIVFMIELTFRASNTEHRKSLLNNQ